MRAGLMLLVGGCGIDNPAFVEPRPLLDEFASQLSPSAAILTSELSEVAAPPQLFLTAHALDDGETAGTLTSFVNADPPTFTHAVFRTTASGATLAVDVASAQAVSLGDEVLFAGHPRFGLTDPIEGYVELEPIGVAPLSAVLGAGATSDRALQYDPVSLDVMLHEIDRVGRTHAISSLPPGPALPPEAWILLVYERTIGTASLVVIDDGTLALLDATGPAVVASGIAVDIATTRAWVGSDGMLRITTSAGLYRWDPATPTATLLDPVPSSPTGTDWVDGAWRGGARAEAGTPNPGDPSVTIPTAMAVRYATDDGFEVFEPPLTPCCDPEACREFGESYLVGGFASQGKAMAVYDVWSWETEGVLLTHVRVARPVVDPCSEG